MRLKKLMHNNMKNSISYLNDLKYIYNIIYAFFEKWINTK